MGISTSSFPDIEANKNSSVLCSIPNETYISNANSSPRSSTLSSLVSREAYAKMLNYSKFFLYTNIIIFDWDDTLMCTSYLTSQDCLNSCDLAVPPHDEERLKALEKIVFTVLTMAIQNGQTYIVTNAGPGWVEYSISKLFPSLLDLMKNVKILSARGLYETKYPGNPGQWKIETFLDIHKAHYDYNTPANIVCIGDSELELEAGNIFAKKFMKSFIKTIKFKENPKVEDLVKQLKLVAFQFESILMAGKNLNIKVEKKNKKIPTRQQ
jgi:hypothetical protein